MIPDAATHAALMVGLRRWLEFSQWTETVAKDNGKFIPKADKFLYDRAWEAEPPPAKGNALERV